MARKSYGLEVQNRTKRLFKALLAYADDELENCDCLKIQVNWKTEKELVVRTKVRFLEELTRNDEYPGKLSDREIKEALNRLEDFLEILKDHRLGDKGLHDWHFTLNFWYPRRDKQANLKRFDQEWLHRRQQIIGERSSKVGSNPPLSEKLQLPVIDWGEAPDASSFYGRTEELNQLEQWIVQDNCKLIALLGMGGIGKTTLAVTLAERIQDKFDYLIWCSLRNAPSVEELLEDLLRVLSVSKNIDLPKTVEGRFSELIDCLRGSKGGATLTHRCLIILDEWESVLSTGQMAGYAREGYEGYGDLLKRVGESHHNSCIILTSWEKPREVAVLEGPNLLVRSFHLTGLGEAARDILKEKGLSEEDLWEELIKPYRGHPLALKIVATTIQDLFGGSVSDFLIQNTLFLGDFEYLLAQHFNRLTQLEKEIMCRLSIHRQPIYLSQLREIVQLEVSQGELLKALESLLRRSLIEKGKEESGIFFTLQPAVMKYVIKQSPRC